MYSIYTLTAQGSDITTPTVDYQLMQYRASKGEAQLPSLKSP